MPQTAGTERIALLGGTFDPPHLGHVVLARSVADALRLDRVVWMPTGNPNFKQDVKVTPAEMRLEMVELACAEDPRFEASAMEIEREGVTYTADTLAELKAAHPGAELLFIVGTDSAMHIMRWRRAEEVAALCTVVAVVRKGFPADAVRAAHENSDIRFDLELLELDVPGISSTEVRAAVAAGESISQLVPAGVERYIVEHGLYLEEG